MAEPPEPAQGFAGFVRVVMSVSSSLSSTTSSPSSRTASSAVITCGQQPLSRSGVRPTIRFGAPRAMFDHSLALGYLPMKKG
jgi:hypothetical protein